MAELQCQIQIPPIEKMPDELTVGRVFILSCAGDVPKFQKDKTEIRLDEKDQYALKLLDLDQQGSNLNLKVVSYKVGDHHLKAVQIVDPEHSAILGNLDFTVQTVISKEEAKPEPYGPVGPFSLGLPWWYFAMWIVALLAIAAFLFLRVKRSLERKKLLEEINNFGTSHTPYTQFTQSVRKWMREFEFLAHSEKMISNQGREKFLQELIQSYRIFLGRTFQVPALQWPDRVFVSEIKKRFAQIYEMCGQDLRKVLREQNHAKSHQMDMKSQDLIQLLDLTRKNVDAIYLAERQQKK